VDDSIASPTEPITDPTMTYAPIPASVPLMAVTHNEAGDLVITIPQGTEAGALIMSLLSGLRTS
jgi:hypothetical protein